MYVRSSSNTLVVVVRRWLPNQYDTINLENYYQWTNEKLSSVLRKKNLLCPLFAVKVSVWHPEARDDDDEGFSICISCVYRKIFSHRRAINRYGFFYTHTKTALSNFSFANAFALFNFSLKRMNWQVCSTYKFFIFTFNSFLGAVIVTFSSPFLCVCVALSNFVLIFLFFSAFFVCVFTSKMRIFAQSAHQFAHNTFNFSSTSIALLESLKFYLFAILTFFLVLIFWNSRVKVSDVRVCRRKFHLWLRKNNNGWLKNWGNWGKFAKWCYRAQNFLRPCQPHWAAFVVLSCVANGCMWVWSWLWTNNQSLHLFCVSWRK